MASPVHSKDQCKVKQVQILSRAGRDSDTTRADSEQDRAMQGQEGQGQVQCTSIRTRQEWARTTAASRPWVGRAQMWRSYSTGALGSGGEVRLTHKGL